MKEFFKKKIVIISIVILIVILLITSFFLYFFLKRKEVVFYLIGEDKVVLGVYEKYNEEGFVARENNKDISSEVVVDNSILDINKLGTYEIVYKIKYKDKEKTLIRKVEVVDNVKPVITLNGEEKINLVLGNNYQEQSVLVVDNYDEDAKRKLQIINEVNTNVVGEYEVIYRVVDNSGNIATKKRKVNVYPNIESMNKDIYEYMDSNRITKMNFIDDGISVTGYVKDNNGNFKIKLCKEDKKDCTSYGMNKKNKKYYTGNISLSNLDNGVYYMWISSKTDEKVINKLDILYQIKKARIGDKLVIFSYDNDNVKLIIDDFKYEYDILIDPGHGGIDSGAANSITNEKELNLIQSLYEKQRYEEHGLKVLLLRNDETYGIVMGSEDWPAVRRKAYALGYYGVTSKISYSNHHNSSEDSSLSGWEIIVPTWYKEDDLTSIYKLRDAFSKSYNTQEEHLRVYTRNYNTGDIFAKNNNQEYYFTDYYAVLRLPYQLFNVGNVLFEGAYLSNINDFNYYYTNDNWKKFSEEKIKVFVESLGVKYINNTR